MVTEMLETERKYEADLTSALPDLTGLPQVAAESEPQELQLEAEYFDTTDLRLLRAGITLRRRTGGDDAGWHLKLPAGPEARQELRLPLGRSRVVPAELSRLVRVHTRRAKLAPVARIATRRHQRDLLDEAGTSLAEVVDDEVSAQSLGEETALLQWREIEIELTAGGRRLLKAADDRLRRAGLRRSDQSAKLERVLADRLPPPAGTRPLTGKSTAGEVVLAYVRGQVSAIKSGDPQVRRQAPDSVHQMRVATRRLRATLKSFKSVLDPAATAGIAAELKWLGGVLGQARDGEVLAGHLAELVEQTPPELVLGTVQARLTEYFAPRNAAAVRAVIRALDSDRYFALLDELDALLAEAPLTEAVLTETVLTETVMTEAAGRPARAVLGPAVAHMFKRERRRARQAWRAEAGATRDEDLHSARKAAKDARYAADLLVPIAGQPARRFAKRMKKIQTLLGDHQDTVIARAAIRDLGIRAHLAGDNAFTFGLLYERDAEASRAAQEKAELAWEKAADPRYRRWLS
jgi:CHAD domain-containing protein